MRSRTWCYRSALRCRFGFQNTVRSRGVVTPDGAKYAATIPGLKDNSSAQVSNCAHAPRCVMRTVAVRVRDHNARTSFLEVVPCHVHVATFNTWFYHVFCCLLLKNINALMKLQLSSMYMYWHCYYSLNYEVGLIQLRHRFFSNLTFYWSFSSFLLMFLFVYTSIRDFCWHFSVKVVVFVN